ncbi:amino acid transporter [Aspergillus campestris IBT 28561]|uniref:Amino acid transporter n=1 Tax=Aspergillus campestris (strain IBT 28561) TaxID=1392248 RepID=A0A2I1DHC7_ASPC2|nr:amino acid transporter [Aspergillus campestris IBT 28561]PKY09271.1 amino acid transporter [Aspergillus campestris IBT 28561]
MVMTPQEPLGSDVPETQQLLFGANQSVSHEERRVFVENDQDKKRHLGLLSTALLLTNRMIGAAIFSVPSAIIQSVGSVGASLSLWLVGLGLALCGLFVWIELGCLMPRSGGEKLYLEVAYPRPPRLITTLYGFFIIFALCGLGSVVVSENLLVAVDISASDFTKRVLSVAVLASIIGLHLTRRDWSVRFMDYLGLLKVFILVLVILTGLIALCGFIPSVPDPTASFHRPFAGSSTDLYSYATALLKVFTTYQGWNNAAYVLDEVKDPRRTMPLAGILGVGLVGILYFLTNISYFIVASPEEISNSGVKVVAVLLGKVFGSGAGRIAAALAALSTYGTLMTSSFTMARVARNLAVENVIPAARFFARETIHGTPAANAYILVFMAASVAITVVPFGDAYVFLTDINQYEWAMVNSMVVLGLFRIRQTVSYGPNQFRVWTIVPLIFLAVQAYICVSPFLYQAHAGRDTSLPYWLPELTAVGAFALGGLYWRYRRHH